MSLNLINTSPEFIEERLKEVVAFQAKIKGLLKADYDYGKVKNCGQKPVLFKAGAEKIRLALNLSTEYEFMKCIEDYKGKGFFSYIIKCKLTTKGEECTQGLGSANSKEPKWAYAWKEEKFLPPNTDITNLPVRLDNNKKLYRVDDETQSKANTILKIAKKRAMVDAVLNVAALSEVFTQDFEDFEDNEGIKPEEHQIQVEQKENVIVLNTLTCSDCGRKIPKSVYEYSLEHYKKSLCMNCQNKLKLHQKNS